VLGDSVPETFTPRTRSRIRALGGAVLVTASVVSFVRGTRRQREISTLIGRRPKPPSTHLVGTVAGVGLATGVLLTARALTATIRLYHAGLRRVIPLPGRVGAICSLVLTGASVVLAVDRVLRGQVLAAMIERAEHTNMLLRPGLRRPTSPLRSGSPASTEPWEALGAAGRRIVAGGAHHAVISATIGRPALEPIRVYAGRRSDRDLDHAVQAVLDELDRTRAWERRVLALFTGTGTGWLQEWSLSAIEFLTGGDCATASLQYSSHPSGLHYVVDRKTPQRAGRMLLEAVRAHLAQLPEDARPRLFVAGESLGSFGGQAAFTDPQDMLEKVDGAVWSGTPGFTPIWNRLTRQRHHASPEIAPMIQDGKHFRFATQPEDLDRSFTGREFGPWQHPRIAYVQHASDPVVWWHPGLLWRRPDWLVEKAGADVSSAVRWAPWITFWQIALDMPLSGEAGGGHGHAYHEELVPVWAAVLGIGDRDGEEPEADLEAITAAIRVHAFPA
jgi:uncharacterized membrane protein